MSAAPWLLKGALAVSACTRQGLAGCLPVAKGTNRPAAGFLAVVCRSWIIRSRTRGRENPFGLCGCRLPPLCSSFGSGPVPLVGGRSVVRRSGSRAAGSSRYGVGAAGALFWFLNIVYHIQRGFAIPFCVQIGILGELFLWENWMVWQGEKVRIGWFD
jgi:hypothetical protein